MQLIAKGEKGTEVTIEVPDPWHVEEVLPGLIRAKLGPVTATVGVGDDVLVQIDREWTGWEDPGDVATLGIALFAVARWVTEYRAGLLPAPGRMVPPPDDVDADVELVLQEHEFDLPDAAYQPEVLTFARAAERVARELRRRQRVGAGE